MNGVISAVGATSVLIFYAAAYMVAILQARVAPLGCRVPVGRVDDPRVTDIQRRYRRTLLVSGLVCVLATFIPTFALVAAGVSVFVGIALWYGYRHKIVVLKRTEGWYDQVEGALVGSVGSGQSRTRIAPAGVAWVLHAASLIPFLIGAGYLWANWESIPAEVPTHFGPDGEVDAYVAKSVLGVGVGMILALSVAVVCLLLAVVIARCPAYARTGVAPGAVTRTGVALWWTQIVLGTVSLATSAGSAILAMAAVPTYPLHGPALAAVFCGILLVPLVAELVAMLVHVHRVRVEPGSVDHPDDDDHYVLGVFYVNADDPAVFVDKRFGVGIDFNYARWQSSVIVALFLVLMVAAVVGVNVIVS